MKIGRFFFDKKHQDMGVLSLKAELVFLFVGQEKRFKSQPSLIDIR
jgi:hypothetical protein